MPNIFLYSLFIIKYFSKKKKKKLAWNTSDHGPVNHNPPHGRSLLQVFSDFGLVFCLHLLSGRLSPLSAEQWTFRWSNPCPQEAEHWNNNVGEEKNNNEKLIIFSPYTCDSSFYYICDSSLVWQNKTKHTLCIGVCIYLHTHIITECDGIEI